MTAATTTQRVCVFCEQRPRSREDFWPHWMLGLFPPGVQTLWEMRAPHTERSSISTRRTLKIWGPCERCNNGWMSQLENAVKPILERMIQGGRRSLSHRDQIALATWGAMKEMVAEFRPGFSRLQVIVNRAQDRRLLMEQQRPPATTRVRLAARVEGNILSCHRVLVFGERSPGTGYEYAACTTLSFGQVVIQVLCAPHSPFRAFRALGAVRDVDISLFPMSYDDVPWPPARKLDGAHLEEYATSTFEVASTPPPAPG